MVAVKSKCPSLVHSIWELQVYLRFTLTLHVDVFERMSLAAHKTEIGSVFLLLSANLSVRRCANKKGKCDATCPKQRGGLELVFFLLLQQPNIEVALSCYGPLGNEE